MVSREWHSFLGFRAYVPCTKRPALFNVSDEEGVGCGWTKKKTLKRKKVVVLRELQRAIIYTTKMSNHVTKSHVRDAVHMYLVN
jgi:hypothetical protein